MFSSYLSCYSKNSQLDPGQEMFRVEFIIMEDDQIVTKNKGCRVREDCEQMRHKVLDQSSEFSLGNRKILKEWFHTGHLEVSVGVGVEVMREPMTDL